MGILTHPHSCCSFACTGLSCRERLTHFRRPRHPQLSLPHERAGLILLSQSSTTRAEPSSVRCQYLTMVFGQVSMQNSIQPLFLSTSDRRVASYQDCCVVLESGVWTHVRRWATLKSLADQRHLSPKSTTSELNETPDSRT
jgi:hypothetical protein